MTPLADAPATDEIELKLRAGDAAPLTALARRRRLGPATLGRATVVAETDRYLDTQDGRLSARRWACRLRDRDGRLVVSLKGPRGDLPASWPAGLHRRPEHEGPANASTVPGRWPPSAARSLLLSLAADRPLVERLILVQRRTERPVAIGAWRVGTLSLDRVDVVHAGCRVGRLWSVELELAATGGESLGAVPAVLDALAAVPGLEVDPSTKLEHALALIGPDGS